LNVSNGFPKISETAKLADEYIKAYFRQTAKRLLDSAVKRESERIRGGLGGMVVTAIAYAGAFLSPSEFTREIARGAYEQQTRNEKEISQLRELSTCIQKRTDSMDIESLSRLLKCLWIGSRLAQSSRHCKEIRALMIIDGGTY